MINVALGPTSGEGSGQEVGTLLCPCQKSTERCLPSLPCGEAEEALPLCPIFVPAFVQICYLTLVVSARRHWSCWCAPALPMHGAAFPTAS